MATLAVAVSTIGLGPLTNLVSLSFPKPLIYWRYPLFSLGAVAFITALTWQTWLGWRDNVRSAERKLRERAQMTHLVEAAMRKVVAANLADVTLLSPGLLARPDVLKQPSSGFFTTYGPVRGDPLERLIRHSEPVTEVFRQAGQSMLILGAGGSGKSVLLAQLCLGLGEADERAGQPPVIPVLVSLSSWHRDDMSLEAWLCRVIPEVYRVRDDLVREWVDDGVLLLVLDDLDQVPIAFRSRAIKAVNEYLRAGPRPIAIACRTAEYLDANTFLELSYAVEVAPLERAVVTGYLDGLDSPVARAASSVPPGDRAWWELVSTPLMLGIISRISAHAPDMDISMSGPVKKRRRRIIAAYLEVLACRQPAAYGPVIPEDGLRWLGWLAVWMSRHDAREFGYDTIGTDWIADIIHPASVKNSPAILLRLAFIPLALANIVIILLGNVLYPLQSALTMIAYGPTLALICHANLRTHHFQPTEPIRPVARIILPTGRNFFGAALVNVLPTIAAIVACESIASFFINHSAGQVINELVVALICSLPGLLYGSEARSIPDQALLAPGTRLRRSRASAWRGVAFVAGPISVVSGALLALRWDDDPLSGVTWFLSYGIVCAACMWLIFGGAPVIQHWVLGRAIARLDYGPPDYLEFLDWAADRMLLHTVGSVYAFPHQEIQDYLATTWEEACRRSR